MQRLSEGSCRAFLALKTPSGKPLECPCSYGQAVFDRRFILDAIVTKQICYRTKFIRNSLARRCCYSLTRPGFGAYLQGPRNSNAGYIARFNQSRLDTAGHSYCCNPNTPTQLCLQFYNQYPSGKCRASPRLGYFNFINLIFILTIVW